MARSFGAVLTNGTITGVVLNSVKESTSADKAEARDANGKVTDVWYYSKTKSISVSGVLDGTLSNEAGSTLTIGSETYGVDSTSIDKTNTGAATFSLDASKKDSATINAYSASSDTSGSGTSGQ